MLTFEQYHQAMQQTFSECYQDSKQEQYLPAVNAYSMEFDSLPHVWDDESHLDYDTMRSMGQTSAALRNSSGIVSPPSLPSSTSVPSVASSITGSPFSGHAQLAPSEHISYTDNTFSMPSSIYDDLYVQNYDALSFGDDFYAEMDMQNTHFVGLHDQTQLVKSVQSLVNVPDTDSDSYPHAITKPQDRFVQFASYTQHQAAQDCSPAPSPTPSSSSSALNTVSDTHNYGASRPNNTARRGSFSSHRSGGSPRSCSGDESMATVKCHWPDCGKYFRDIKAHLTTHESERPEKCPIIGCDYNKKGFTRKYDRNRHTLTHYRGTMICGFCPGSGTANEKSFNRADVFKRHLTQIHGVEQAPPNSRKRSSSKGQIKLSNYCIDATGKCSICARAFQNAQDFYEHLDECVLDVVQKVDPSEAINAASLSALVNDPDVRAIFDRNNIKQEEDVTSLVDEDEDDDDDEDDDVNMQFSERSGRGMLKSQKAGLSRPIIGGNIHKKSMKKGMTWSKGGWSIGSKSRKRRKFYPPSWGMAADKMNMRKRVLCVYDGQRRLLKDDLMMPNEFEVRIPLLEADAYVTDLDVETMKRADAFLNMSEADKGPWLEDPSYANNSWA